MNLGPGLLESFPMAESRFEFSLMASLLTLMNCIGTVDKPGHDIRQRVVLRIRSKGVLQRFRRAARFHLEASNQAQAVLSSWESPLEPWVHSRFKMETARYITANIQNPQATTTIAGIGFLTDTGVSYVF